MAARNRRLSGGDRVAEVIDTRKYRVGARVEGKWGPRN